MRPRIAIIYNEPLPCRYQSTGEQAAVLGVLEEVEAVYKALNELGYPVSRTPLLPPLDQVRETLARLEADLVFNLFEGFDGRPETEAAVAYQLSELGLRYTGCSGAALSLALDKGKTKALLQAAGLNTPRYQILDGDSLAEFDLNYPCIVKPYAEDASHGISEMSVVSAFPSLERQTIWVSSLYGGKALVEEFIEGREFNTTVLGDGNPTVLPISEIAYALPPGAPRILTYAAKWEPRSTYYEATIAVCPAEIESQLWEQIESAATLAFNTLGCAGYARVDFRLDAGERLHIIEVNPNPDISPTSGAARQAQAAGMSYRDFIERVVLIALQRFAWR